LRHGCRAIGKIAPWPKIAKDAQLNLRGPEWDSRRMHARLADRNDRQSLLDLWERSVRATHLFLRETDIEALKPAVADELARSDIAWWVLVSEANELLAFLGFKNRSIEALFVEPAHRGRGVGRLLLTLAERFAEGDLFVEVNEQNAVAVRFYETNGFAAVGRSPTDDAGRPFPILRMRRKARAYA
jgi:putative acetyltransferase